MYHFQFTCVGSPDVAELTNMIDRARDVSRRTFMSKCGESARQVFAELGYESHPARGLTAANDYHISYHRSLWNGQRCYFFTWSAIEHVFLREQTA